MPTLCLGEALVDLVCERAVSGLAEADAAGESARATERWGALE